MRIAFTIEAESNYLRQPPIDIKELNQNPIIDNQNTELNLKQNEIRSNIRNQSAISSIISNNNSFKLTSNMISNIFEDFFLNTNDLFN